MGCGRASRRRTIEAPPFPPGARGWAASRSRWRRCAGARCWWSSGTAAGRNSLRTLPYLKAWHERYRERGLTVVSVHSPGFRGERGRGERPRRRGAPGDRARGAAGQRLRAVARVRERGLAGALPVGSGRHARRLPLRRGRLRGVRARDRRGARRSRSSRSRRCDPRTPRGRCSRRPRPTASSRRSTVPTRRARCGRCSTAAALLRVNGREIDVAQPGAHLLIEHDGHGAGELVLEPGEGVSVEARLLHARTGRGASSCGSRLAEQPYEPGVDTVGDDDRAARPVGALGVAREGLAEDPRADVVELRAVGRQPLRAARRPQADRRDGCARRSRGARRCAAARPPRPSRAGPSGAGRSSRSRSRAGPSPPR